MPSRSQFAENQVYDASPNAVQALADATGLSSEQALAGLRAVVAAGYVVAPRLPSNAMLMAYLTSYGQLAVNPATTITALGKARRRWAAMAGAGTAAALSRKQLRD